jgi:hypothetical protein
VLRERVLARTVASSPVAARRRSRRAWVGLTCALLLAICLTHVTAASSATDRLYVLEGHGYGHGVGMGQYGADGFAAHGLDYRAVLAHYYPGTRIAEVPRTAHVRVLLLSSASTVVVGSVTPFNIVDGAGKSAVLVRVHAVASYTNP